MAVTHTWTVASTLQTKTEDGYENVVFSAVWNLSSEETVDETTYSISSANQIKFDVSDLSDFTPFADLTESQVVGWAKAAIDANAAEGEGVTCAEWEAGHERNISKQKSPPTRNQKAPWATS